MSWSWPSPVLLPTGNFSYTVGRMKNAGLATSPSFLFGLLPHPTLLIFYTQANGRYLVITCFFPFNSFLMRWLETISRWLFCFIQICVSACRQKYLNYAHSAVAFPLFFYSSTRNWSCGPFQVFFLRYTYKARRASPISTSISTTSTSTTLLDVPTLPYLTLHYSPSREVGRYYTRKEVRYRTSHKSI